MGGISNCDKQAESAAFINTVSLVAEYVDGAVHVDIMHDDKHFYGEYVETGERQEKNVETEEKRDEKGF